MKYTRYSRIATVYLLDSFDLAYKKLRLDQEDASDAAVFASCFPAQ